MSDSTTTTKKLDFLKEDRKKELTKLKKIFSLGHKFITRRSTFQFYISLLAIELISVKIFVLKREPACMYALFII